MFYLVLSDKANDASVLFTLSFTMQPGCYSRGCEPSIEVIKKFNCGTSPGRTVRPVQMIEFIVDPREKVPGRFQGYLVYGSFNPLRRRLR